MLTKVHMVKAIFFPVVISGHESRVIEEAKKSWFFWIVVLGCHSCIESPLGSKEIKPINPKGSQPWIFIERTDGEAEAPILWPPDEKSWLIGKDPDAGKYWRQKKKGATEDEIDSITSSVDMNLSKIWELVKDRGAWHDAVHGVAKSWMQLSNWTTTKFLGLRGLAKRQNLERTQFERCYDRQSKQGMSFRHR